MTARGRPRHPDILTPAEWQVLHAVRHGMSNRVIARWRGTSVDAVRFHLGNIAAKLELPGKAALRRWEGYPAESRTREETMDEPLQLGPLGQVSMNVSDIERSVTFYRDVLGLPHLFTSGQLAFFDCGGVRLFLDALPEVQGRASSVLYFSVPAIGAAYRELTTRGVKFSGAPHLIHKDERGAELWMAFFEDPDANVLAVMSEVAAEA